MASGSMSGTSRLPPHTPANYDVVITADDHATAVIAGVPVPSSTSITILSTNALPSTLQTSTPPRTIGCTVTLNPATDDETVFLVAKQTLVSDPTVAVKSQTATLVTGNPPGDYVYNLTLPVGAPSLAPYSATLPITPTAAAQSTVAGKYAVEASAAGYATQSFNKDISVTNATQDFSLTP